MRTRKAVRANARRARWIALAAGLLGILAPLRNTPWGVATARAADPADSLAATSEEPWNPPAPIPARRTWEQVVLMPGRVASLPLSGLGYATRSLVLYLEENGRIPTGPQTQRARSRRPISLQLPKIGERAGIGGAVEARTPSRGALPVLSARYAGTVRLYNQTLLGISDGPLSVQYGNDWRPREPFYGLGASSSHDSLANYASHDEFVRGTAGWSSADSSRYGPRFALQAWGGPRSRVTRTGREDSEASYDVLFPALATATLDRRVEHLTYGASATADWRMGRPHWSRGAKLRVAAERYDDPTQALALHSAQALGATFTKYTIEAETGFSFLNRDPRTLRFYGRVVDDQIESSPERFLFSDLARLGGREGLSGFSPGRFRDLDLLLTRVTYVFPLARLFEFELHSEWGSVYPDVWSDASLASLRSSYGFTLRGRSDNAARGALGLDWSRESVRLRYSLGVVE